MEDTGEVIHTTDCDSELSNFALSVPNHNISDQEIELLIDKAIKANSEDVIHHVHIMYFQGKKRGVYVCPDKINICKEIEVIHFVETDGYHVL